MGHTTQIKELLAKSDDKWRCDACGECGETMSRKADSNGLIQGQWIWTAWEYRSSPQVQCSSLRGLYPR